MNGKGTMNVYVDGKSIFGEYLGLGNILYQVATAIYYSEKYNYRICLINNPGILYGTSNYFGRNKSIIINSKYIGYNITILHKLNWVESESSNCQIIEHNYSCDTVIPDMTKDIFIKGYCQNISLFKEYIHKIPDYLKLSDSSIINYINKKYPNLGNSICIGLRIGEDFQHMTKIKFDSYKKALHKFKEMDISIDTIYILSDIKDGWNLHFDTLSEFKAVDVDEADIIQFYVGLHCKHYILSESTFHAWIAYLGMLKSPDKKAICFNDTDITNKNLSMESWIRIDY